MRRTFWKVLASILGLFLAKEFIKGVTIVVIPGKSNYLGINFTQTWQIILFLGIILGIFRLFIRPLLELITLPLKILTLGLFSIILNMAILAGMDSYFPELTISGIWPLFLTTFLIEILELLLSI